MLTLFTYRGISDIPCHVQGEKITQNILKDIASHTVYK